MIHLVFLALCFVAVLLIHKLVLTILSSREQWKGKWRLYLIALSMPGMALFLFSLLMLPGMMGSQSLLQQSWEDAFFYLPSSWTILQVLRKGQEESCDAWVAKVRGKDTALALASALLKVWEDLLQAEGKSVPIAPSAPGLTSEKDPSLTEQRVLSLISQTQDVRKTTGEHGSTQWGAKLALASMAFVWLSTVGAMHLLLLPLGCVLFFHLG